MMTDPGYKRVEQEIKMRTQLKVESTIVGETVKNYRRTPRVYICRMASVFKLAYCQCVACWMTLAASLMTAIDLSVHVIA